MGNTVPVQYGLLHLNESIFEQRSNSISCLAELLVEDRVETVFSLPDDSLESLVECTETEEDAKEIRKKKTNRKTTLKVTDIIGKYKFDKLVDEILSLGFQVDLVRFFPRPKKNRTNAYIVFKDSIECRGFLDMVKKNKHTMTSGALKAKNIKYSDIHGMRIVMKKFGHMRCAEANTWVANP